MLGLFTHLVAPSPVSSKRQAINDPIVAIPRLSPIYPITRFADYPITQSPDYPIQKSVTVTIALSSTTLSVDGISI